MEELSPTSDINLVKSLMNLIDCHIAEFKADNNFTQFNDHNSSAIVEVSSMCLCVIHIVKLLFLPLLLLLISSFELCVLSILI